jgi:hypothetical protein
MPLVYGEGNKAFIRLQEEIMKDSEDQSLFAWALCLGPATATHAPNGIGQEGCEGS